MKNKDNENKANRKRIFVTGSTGFVGKKLIPELAKEYNLVCFTREGERDEKNINIRVGDLKNLEDIKNASKGSNIILHMANSEKNPYENAEFMKNIIDAAKKNKIKKIIFFSSMAAKRTMKDNYGKSKLECENILKNSGIDYIIIRPTIIYSHEEIPFFAKPIKMVPFIIPVISNGNYKINPVYIGDLIILIKKIIKSKKSNRTYEIAGGEDISYNEIIELIKKEKKINKITVHIPTAISLILNKFMKFSSKESIKGINEDTNVDINLAEKDFNFKPIKFKEDIKNVII